MKNNRLSIGSFAKITDSAGNILLCYRNDLKKWNLPGGRMEDNETPWEAAIREVKEETSLDVKIDKLIGVYSKSDINDLSFYFKATVLNGVAQISKESAKVEYFEIDNLPQNIVLQHKVAIENKDKLALKKQLQRLFIEIDGEEKEY